MTARVNPEKVEDELARPRTAAERQAKRRERAAMQMVHINDFWINETDLQTAMIAAGRCVRPPVGGAIPRDQLVAAYKRMQLDLIHSLVTRDTAPSTRSKRGDKYHR